MSTTDLCPAYGDRPAAECHCQICMDPFHGDQKAENDDYEANAPYDYLREAFGGDAEDPATLEAEAEERAQEWSIQQQDAMEARGGPVFDLLLAQWNNGSVAYGEIPF